jgi:hypothetical protein
MSDIVRPCLKTATIKQTNKGKTNDATQACLTVSCSTHFPSSSEVDTKKQLAKIAFYPSPSNWGSQRWRGWTPFS